MKITKFVSFLIFIAFYSWVNASSSINSTCFREYGSFVPTWTSTQKLKIDSTSRDIFFLQWDNLVSYKIFGEEKRITIPYSVNLISSWNETFKKYLNDWNGQTAFTFDNINDKNKTIILDLWATLKANDFDFNSSIINTWPVRYYISSDNNSYNEVKEYNISSFSFRYLKIVFSNFSDDNTVNETKINELSFSKRAFSNYLVNPINAEKINIYRWYECNYEAIKDVLNKYNLDNSKARFSIDSNTKETNITFEPNKIYNSDFDNDWIKNDTDNCIFTYNSDQGDIDEDLVGDKCDFDNSTKNPLDSDIDKDWFWDSVDNCKYIYNPSQKDSDANSIWDDCSDNDNDSIIWNLDNCPSISNPDQKDVNINNIWDACEFDKDKDNIFDSVDNCITTLNPDQKDSDLDSIGDVCDNCKLYNPDQKDANWNKVWDVCEQQELFEKNNDSDWDSKLDFEDNCKSVANPWQEDLDKDSVWDACDNCLSIQNTDQNDEDKNKIWDMCEDIDKDSIDWYRDNCPNIPNPDQKDSNNDSIGDVCGDEDNDGIINSKDNCMYEYNPDQSDVDKDKKWDTCDKKDDRYVESNRTFFATMLILIVSVFLTWIYFMVKKLKGGI